LHGGGGEGQVGGGPAKDWRGLMVNVLYIYIGGSRQLDMFRGKMNIYGYENIYENYSM
jgi:hypothetical protein